MPTSAGNIYFKSGIGGIYIKAKERVCGGPATSLIYTVLLCLIHCFIHFHRSRCLGVLILSALANHYRLQKLGAVDQFVMMYGGLRGAVAFALVLLVNPHVVPHAHMFVTTTIAMIYWTVFVQVTT
jgi:sodium/hydrogen exchanger-like protein 3